MKLCLLQAPLTPELVPARQLSAPSHEWRRRNARDEPASSVAAEGAGAPPSPPKRRRTRGVIAALRAPDPAYERRLKLTDVIGFVALNGYAREADACAGLNRETWRCIPAGLSAADADRVRRDHPLWQAIIDLKHGGWKQTRLALAARHGSLARVRELFDWRADVEAGDIGGVRPLLRASFEGTVDVVRELLARGASANTTALTGHTPLLLSSRRGYVEVVRALLAAGADKHHIDDYGATAASIAGAFAPDFRAAILALLAAAP
jgi:hypothetical protein